MTDEELDAVVKAAETAKALADAATPGPWVYPSGGRFPYGVSTECGTCQVVADVCRAWEGLPFVRGTPADNRAFIAAARHDVPALCAAVLRLADEVRTLRAVLGDACKESALYEQGVRDALRAIRSVNGKVDGGSSTKRGLELALEVVRRLLPE